MVLAASFARSAQYVEIRSKHIQIHFDLLWRIPDVHSCKPICRPNISIQPLTIPIGSDFLCLPSPFHGNFTHQFSDLIPTNTCRLGLPDQFISLDFSLREVESCLYSPQFLLKIR